MAQHTPEINMSAGKVIKVIELRNYRLKPGQREKFTQLFETKFIRPQQEAGSYPLGQFSVKNAADNFFWIRGFKDMGSRYQALNQFYHGDTWKQNRNEANSSIINNDDVYLLKPLGSGDGSRENKPGFNSGWFGQHKGIVVVDFYISNTKLDKLIAFTRNHYEQLLKQANIKTTSFWVSEMAYNDFPALPVFQDKNLLVQITFYQDETEYHDKMKLIDSNMNPEQKAEMGDLVTTLHTLIIYPTKNSFNISPG